MLGPPHRLGDMHHPLAVHSANRSLEQDGASDTAEETTVERQTTSSKDHLETARKKLTSFIHAAARSDFTPQ